MVEHWWRRRTAWLDPRLAARHDRTIAAGTVRGRDAPRDSISTPRCMTQWIALTRLAVWQRTGRTSRSVNHPCGKPGSCRLGKICVGRAVILLQHCCWSDKGVEPTWFGSAAMAPSRRSVLAAGARIIAGHQGAAHLAIDDHSTRWRAIARSGREATYGVILTKRRHACRAGSHSRERC